MVVVGKMKAILSIKLSEKDFIKAKYLEFGKKIPKNRKTIKKELKEYLEQALYESAEEWTNTGYTPDIEYER